MIHIVTLKLSLVQHSLQTILIVLLDSPHTLAHWLGMNSSCRTALCVRGRPRRMIRIICKKDNGEERQNVLFCGRGQVEIVSNCPLCNKPVKEEGSKHSQKGLSCQTYTHIVFPKVKWLREAYRHCLNNFSPPPPLSVQRAPWSTFFGPYLFHMFLKLPK